MRHHSDHVHPSRPGALLCHRPVEADGLYNLPDGGHQADGVTSHNDDHNIHSHPRDQNLPLPDQFLDIDIDRVREVRGML